MRGECMEGVTHGLTIEDCRLFSATGIESVDGFSSTRIALGYAGGRILISGSGLKINAFSKSSGAFSASGTVTEVKYLPKGIKLARRLLK